MRIQPDFFAEVLEESQKRWNTLQGDPGLKGPWDQLFKQVQRPEHVISELLQNADDAQATWVKLSLTEEAFIFEHNGVDFDAKSFCAICSFGVSNKPFLKTIGQWGIGFKSVFSLGERVEILTPSLAFAFEKSRYIVPEWLEDAEAVDHTVIRILWQEESQKEIAQAQIERWREDALPLVFFHHIQTLTLEGDCFSHNVQDGPTPSSRWVTLITPEGEETLLLALQTVQFGDLPEEVRKDIQKQLPLKNGIPSETSLTVSLIAGRSEVNKIYVVLPTTLHVDSLPCSLNAPFIQDPGRVRIDQPLYSAANRWFLEALGKLAAQTLMDWLDNRDVSLEERASAYEWLLPISPQVSSSASDRDYVQPFLQGFRAVWEQFPGRHYLTTGGDLTDASSCFDLPVEFFQVWDEPDLRRIFLKDSSHAFLAPEVEEQNRERLANWDVHWERKDVRSALHCLWQPPKPANWDRLAILWELAYRSEYDRYSYGYSSKNLPLFPAQGRDWLYFSAQVLPLSEGAQKNFTPEEYGLILRWVNLIDPDWLAYLKGLDEHHPARWLYRLLDDYRFHSISSQDLFQKAVSAFFDQDSWEEEDAIRWAWIAARLKLSLSECTFWYLCQDGQWRDPKKTPLFAKLTPELETVLPPEMHKQHVLHEKYHQGVPKEYKTSWNDWLSDLSKSCLRGFIPLSVISKEMHGEESFEEFLSQRGGHKPEWYPRTCRKFVIKDIDFSTAFLELWRSQEAREEGIWANVLKCILEDWEVGDWEKLLYIRDIYQYSVREPNRLEVGTPLANWIFNLRQKRCVLDEHGRLRYPYEVYRQNEHTRPLKGILTFLHRDFDRPGRDALYRALGVPERPQDVQIFMDRLRALSQIQPSHQNETYIKEVDGLFSSLAQIWDSLEVSQQEQARQTFREETLLLAEDGTWHTAEDIFQKNPKKLPGVAVLHPVLLHLEKWQKIISIPPEPTLDHILDWLRRLPRGEPLAEETLKRVKEILRKYPHQVWEDVQGWVNGRGEWVATCNLTYWATPQDLESLHEDLREQCADASMFSHDLRDEIPLPALHRALDWRLDRRTPLHPSQPIPEWLKALAHCLQQVRLPENSQQALVAEQAQRLAGTHIIDVKRGELWATPYLEGVPAGSAVRKNVVWTQQMLVVKHARYEEITNEVSRFFPDTRLQKAIHAMWKRPVEQIEMYFREEFAQDFLENPVQAPAQPRSPVPDPESVTLPPSEASTTTAVAITSVSRRDRWEVLWEEKGFTRVSSFQWVNPDGESILREASRIFPYSRYSPDGHLLESFFGAEIHSYREISLPAEVWNVLQSSPERVTLVLWEDQKATLYPGARLWEDVQSDRVKLYPETYRLKLT